MLSTAFALALQQFTPIADAYCEGGVSSTTNFGSSSSLIVKSVGGTGDLRYTRSSWLAFDVRNKPPAMPNATLLLTPRSSKVENGAGPHVVRLYGLREAADRWSERSIHWDNAPGNDRTSSYLDPEAVVLLDSRRVASITAGTPVALGGPKLGQFVNGDTDGVVTMVVAMQPLGSSTEIYQFHSRESSQPPRLDLGVAPAPRPTSSWVSVDANGQLVYRPDSNGNILPDFSMVGYRRGEESIPDVPARVTLAAASGDQTARIQSAIHQVGALPIGADGFRGAVELGAGRFDIGTSLSIPYSGVVLRGAGDGPSGGTVLRATNAVQRTLISLGGRTSWRQVGAATQVTDSYVPVGASSFRVADASAFSVGDPVLVHRPSTSAWITAIGMDRLQMPWAPGSKDLRFDRVITAIQGNLLTVDAPLTTALERVYGGARVYRYTINDRADRIGVEDLRSESIYSSPTDENHAWTFIRTDAVTNCWVRRCTAQHYGYAAVDLGSRTKWATVEDCKFLDPISQITGSRRYPFTLRGQLSLFQRCFAEEGRHDFVVHSLVPGPNVFFDCVADNSHSSTGPHHRWSCGTLFDNIVVTYASRSGGGMEARNRGNSGTGHGWAGANTVFWNTTAQWIEIDNPPTAHNWAIGHQSPASDYRGRGSYEHKGRAVDPPSLYLAQRAARQAGRCLPNCLWTNPDVVRGSNLRLTTTGRANTTTILLLDAVAGRTPLGPGGQWGTSGLGFSPALVAWAGVPATDHLGRSTIGVAIPRAIGSGRLFAEGYLLDLSAPNGLFWMTNVAQFTIR